MNGLTKTAEKIRRESASQKAEEEKESQRKRDNLFLKFAEKNTTIALAGVVVLGVMVLAAIGVGVNGIVEYIEKSKQQVEYIYQTYFSAESDMNEVCPKITGKYLETLIHSNPNVFLPIRDAMTPGSIVAKQIKSGDFNREEFVKLINPFVDGALMGNQNLQEINDALNSEEMLTCNESGAFAAIKEAFNNWATAFINLDFVLAQQYAREFDEWSLYLVDQEKFKISLMQLNQLVFEAEDPRGYEEFLKEQEAIEKILNSDPCALLGEPFSSATEVDGYTFYCSAIDSLIANGQITSDENGFPLGSWSVNNAFLGK